MGERLAKVEEWIEGHEFRCEDRQRSMGREIGELKTNVGGLTKGAWGVVVALLAWAATQLWTVQVQVHAQAAPPPAASAQR